VGALLLQTSTQVTNQPTNQPTNQLTNQPTNQPTNLQHTRGTTRTPYTFFVTEAMPEPHNQAPHL